jgi:hypothetical protein
VKLSLIVLCVTDCIIKEVIFEINNSWINSMLMVETGLETLDYILLYGKVTQVIGSKKSPYRPINFVLT